MKTMKVLILGGEAVGVVDGGCELVEVPVIGGKESELGFKPGFLGAVDADLGSKGLDHMKVPFEGGVPVTVDYKAEVRAYLSSVPEGGVLTRPRRLSRRGLKKRRSVSTFTCPGPSAMRPTTSATRYGLKGKTRIHYDTSSSISLDRYKNRDKESCRVFNQRAIQQSRY